ncbi:MAG: ABC transporter ATP-binding protein [Beijerinckiaceae bacterium]
MLRVEEMSVGFASESGQREVLSRVSLSLDAGQVLGVVGESGSGKSVTALSVIRLLGAQGRITGGRISFDGRDLTALSESEMQQLRGREIAMIFQEPMTSLNPLLTIGFQIAEVLETHLGLRGAAARRRVIELLDEVGIPAPEARYDDAPFRLSGGMRQRVMIAMAMACQPKLLIADEPTTALDVTIQAQILGLMHKLRREHGSAILLITHDMGVIARLADHVAVMYAGEVVESADSRSLFAEPVHPYTRLLMAAMPSTRRRAARLPVIEGQMPAPGEIRKGCRFEPRCPDRLVRCAADAPPIERGPGGRQVRCWLAAERMATATAAS